MDTQNGLSLNIQCDKGITFAPEVLGHAETMLLALLNRGGMPARQFRFFAFQKSDAVANHSGYYLQMESLHAGHPAAHVALKSTRGPNGTIRGMLWFQSGEERDEACQRIAPILTELNQEGWKSVFSPEGRNGSKGSTPLDARKDSPTLVSANTVLSVVVTLSPQSELYQEVVSVRTQKMVEALLKAALAPIGTYPLEIFGLHRDFESLTHNRLELYLPSEEGILLLKLRVRHGKGGSVIGRLRVDPTTREQLCERMQVALPTFNDDGWVSTLYAPPPADLPEASPQEGVSLAPEAVLIDEAVPTAGVAALDQPPDLSIDTSILPEASEVQERVVTEGTPQTEALSTNKSLAEGESIMETGSRESHAQVLLELLENADREGVLSIEGKNPIARKHFPQLEPRGLLWSVMRTMRTWGWVEFLGGKGGVFYRVQPAFLDLYPQATSFKKKGLNGNAPSASLSAAQSSGSGMSAQATVAPSPPPTSDISTTVVTAASQIRSQPSDLVRVVRDLQLERGALVAAAEVARQKVREAEQALATFDEGLRAAFESITQGGGDAAKILFLSNP